MPDYEATSIALAVIGTVSVGTIVLLQIQAMKQLMGDWLHGRRAIIATLIASLLAQVIAFASLSVDWHAGATYPALYIAALGTFVSAVSQYAMLFKISAPGSPPGPNAEATAISDPAQATGEYPVVTRR